MNIFIAGASGLVGGNCLRYFKAQGWNVVGSHFSYATPDTVYYNTLEPEHPDNFDLAAFRPDAIVHCGALTHVDYCEQHPEESYRQTVSSTEALAQKAAELGSRLVYISTDYVFDGVEGPYTEDAVVNPISLYGMHKLHAEQHALMHNERPLVLRVTNVYGDELRGKNFIARIIEQCRAGAELKLKLPVDQYASPANAYDIARAMYLLLRDGKQGIYHIGSTDYMNRVELALRVLKHFPDAKYQLEALPTEELRQPAPRPLRGGFVGMKFRSEYPEFLFSNVEDYLQEQMREKKNAPANTAGA